MDSPKKASVKHIEFQLQREKALTRELEAKCKDFHAQIARLEQEKAELRREKLQLSEETKKSARYEDRIHVLQRELENKEAIIIQERSNAAVARAETEDVRFNANASIASWKQAEEQWIAEQAVLNEMVMQQKDELLALRSSFETNRSALAETQRNLQKEQDRCSKIDSSREKLETELRAMHAKVEKFQNQICDLEQKVYNLDLAGEKQRDALNLKDTEIRSLEAKIAKQTATEERMEQTISSLNDRINAAKMVNLEGKGEKETLLCDLADARKESQRLAMQLDSLKRDAQLAAQSQVTLQKTVEELREKLRGAQEDLREKNVEVRRHELTISQLTVELKKLESSTSEGSLRCSALETEIHQLKEDVKKVQKVNEHVSEERDTAKEEVKALKVAVEKREEDAVMLKAQMDDHVESLQAEIRSWELEVSKRQDVIQELTEQLGSTNDKNAMYHRKFLDEAEMCAKHRHESERLRDIVVGHQRNAMFAQCTLEKNMLLLELHEYQQTTLKSVLMEVWMSCTNYASRVAQQEEALSEQQRRLQELTVTNEKLTTDLEDTQRQLDSARANCKSIEESMWEKESRRLSLLQKDAASKEEIALLLKKVANLEDDARAAEASRRQLVDDLQRQIREQTSRCEATAAFSDKQLAILDECWAAKVVIACEHTERLAASRDAQAAAMLAEKERLERQNQELTAFVEEVKSTSTRKDVALAERQEAQLRKTQKLEGCLQALTKEKEQISFQLSTLVSRFEDEQRASERFKKEAHDALRDEKARCEAAEKQCAKLRNGIDYEIKRKCEYKAALEEVKRLREETERCRQREKSFATDAIGRANDEATYWIKCFDKLKTLAETSRRNGTRLPSIDRDTLSRLEAARGKIERSGKWSVQSSGPGREIPVNVVPPSSGPIDEHRGKRARIDSCE